jgi:hypothetical protein
VGTNSSTGTATLGDYRTRVADGGPRHLVRADLALRSASEPPTDVEADGSPTSTARGDDTIGTADEQSLRIGVMRQSVTDIDRTSVQLAAVLGCSVSVENGTGQRAFLTGFLDANNDGDFADPGESAQWIVPSAPGIQTHQLEFQASWTLDRSVSSWTVRLPVRVRLSTVDELEPDGVAPDGTTPDGEVEDHFVTPAFGAGS